MTDPHNSHSRHGENVRKIEHEIEDRLAHGQNVRSTVHEEIHKLRQLDSSHGRLNRQQFQTDLQAIDHKLHQKHLLPHLHIVTHGKHAGALVSDGQKHPAHPGTHPAPPGSHPAPNAEHGERTHEPNGPNEPGRRQQMPPPQSSEAAPIPEPHAEPAPTRDHHPHQRLPHSQTRFRQLPAADAPPETPATPPASSQAPNPTLPERPEARPPQGVPPPQEVRPPQEVSPASERASGQLSTLKSAIERAKAGGRPLTIAQIGDSHIKFGIETAALASQLGTDSGLGPGQVQFSQFGDVGKTASYANENPAEFLRNINQNTDLVFVSFGSNEGGAPAGSQYAEDYAQLISKIRQKAPQAAIVMVGPTDGNFWNSSRHLPYLDSVAEAQQRVAAGVPDSAYIRVGPQMGSVSQMRKNGLMRADNLHLTPSGYRRLGSIIADDLQTLLKQQV